MDLGAGITAKGQVTVPKKLRDALGLKTGDRVYFVPDGRKALMIPARGDLLSLRGILKRKFGIKNTVDKEVLRDRARQRVGEAYLGKKRQSAA